MMGNLRAALLRAWGFVTRRGGLREADLQTELQFHTDMLASDLRRQGMTPGDAAREARLRLGGPTQVVEAYGDQRSIPAAESLLQDVRYAVRTYRRAPALTLAALVTLALGVGATTSIFSVVNTVLLRPLPYANPDRLVGVGDGASDSGYDNVGYATFADYRDRNRSFERMVAVRSWQTTLVTTEAERLAGMRVSWNYFDMLGVRPALGRTFRKEDDRRDGWRVLVLSDSLWRRRFNADPAVIGRTLRMNDQQYEIVGVMPAGFDDVISARFYKPAELWAALGYDPSLPYACRSCQHLKAFGQLRPGVTAKQATDDLAAVRAELTRQWPAEYDQKTHIGIVPLQDAVSGPVKEPLYVLLAAVGFVLLIACANVANLLLARGMSRSREMAVRAALGAGRARLVRQLVTESLLLWTVGGAAGVALGALLLRALADLAPVDLPRAAAIGIDGSVLAFSALLSIATGLIFGLVPALNSAPLRLTQALGSNTRASVGSSSRRARHALVIVDLAVALVLLVGAGLMLKSVGRLVSVDPGFNSAGVLTAQFSLIGEAYREDPAVYAFIERVVDRVKALPGVTAAAAAGQVPMGGNGDRYGLHIEGLEPANPAEAPSPERYSVTPDYFKVMQIPLRRGRLLTQADTTTSAPVMLISETAARTLFQGHDPIGRRVHVGDPTGSPWRTIVGIVGDVRHADLAEKVWPQMYFPQSQLTDSYIVLAIRTSTSDPAALAPAVRAIVHEADPTVPVYDVATLEALLAKSVTRRRFVMLLLVGFAGVSLLLAAVGLYGVISYTVAQRTREVGLRIALGAGRAHIFRLVLGAGAITLVAGVTAGLVASLVVTRFLQGQLFQVEPLDPGAIAGAVAALGVVAVAAHLVPIRRALRVDPTIALRQD
jgi:putative ABC transport system permease protein